MVGYVVRSAAEGWIQGFITQTVFTTWQRYFTWDSLAHEAGVLEDAEDEPDSKCDVTGIMGRELAAQVHAGDPDGGGVIWPHIAEVSLLAGIGCGGWLLKLMIEELEQPGSPYEFAVLQASENSINFYEHHGFVRVGALARYEDEECLKRAADAAGSASVAPETGRISSPTVEANAKDNETPSQVATRLGVKVSDVMFLNKDLYPGLTTSSKLKGGTKLRVPVVKPPPQERTDGLPPVYMAKNDETPRQIANKLGIDCKTLVNLNKRFLTGLNQHSRLKSNSKLRIPSEDGVPPDQDDWTLFGDVVGYRHWTFPDEHESAISNTGVSYMMARKLTRKKGRSKANPEPEEGSMMASLQRRKVDHPPQMKVTRTGVGIAVPSAPVVGNDADSGGDASASGDQDKKSPEPHGVKRERDDAAEAAVGAAAAAPAAAPQAPVWVPPTGPMVIDAANYKAVKSALMAVRKQTSAEPFIEPVPEEVEGYYERIKHPMDLTTIKKKLEESNRSKYNGRQGYVTVPEIEADIELILSNCREFNTGTPHGEFFINMADALGAFVRKTFGELDSNWRAGKYVKAAAAAAAASPRGSPRDDPDAKRQKRMPKNLMAAVWEALVNARTDDKARPIAELFVDLPPKADYPDYYRAVAKPVSLNCIKRKIDARKYDLPLFKKDVDLLIENARTYNMPGSIVVQDAEALGEIFKTKAAAANAKWKKDELASQKAAEAALVEDPADVERREAMAELEKRKPEKPKRATTGFFAFVSDRRAGMREAHPELSVTDIGKQLGVEWKALTDEEKAKYEAVAAEDRVRAAAAKESWTVAMEAWERERHELLIRLGTAEEKQAALIEQHKARKPVPVRTNTPYMCYSITMRAAISQANGDLSTTQVTQEIAKAWNAMDDEGKAPFVDMAEQEKEAAAPALAKYEREIGKWKKEMDSLLPRPVRDTKRPSYLEDDGLMDFEEATRGGDGGQPRRATEKQPPKLFNKVVRVDGLGERYYYVLTYIPDLFWCRVAPMRQAGTFSADREKAAKNVTGRPRWMLEPEGEGGGELDVSAMRCQQVKARAVRRVQDADKEEWDVSDPKPTKAEKVSTTSTTGETEAVEQPVGVEPATEELEGKAEEKPTSADDAAGPVDDMQTDEPSAGSVEPASTQDQPETTTAASHRVRQQNLPPRDPDAPACRLCKLGRGVCRKWNLSGHLQGEPPNSKDDDEPTANPSASGEEDDQSAAVESISIQPGQWARTGHPFLGCSVKARREGSAGVVKGVITQYRAPYTEGTDAYLAAWKVVNDDGSVIEVDLDQVTQRLQAADEWKEEWAALPLQPEESGDRLASSPPEMSPDSPTDEESEEEPGAGATAAAASESATAAAGKDPATTTEIDTAGSASAADAATAADMGDAIGADESAEGGRKRKAPAAEKYGLSTVHKAPLCSTFPPNSNIHVLT
jgi:hypothetical protein|eukprot:COSAG06_NODE_49_length_28591_cov_18.281623_13_plen_1437_part_00